MLVMPLCVQQSTTLTMVAIMTVGYALLCLAICYIDSGKHDLVMSFCFQQSATLTMADMTLGYAILCPAVCNTNSGKHDSWLCHFVSSNLKH